MTSHWLHLADAADERNEDLRAEERAAAGASVEPRGRYYGYWQFDEDYELGDER